MKFKISGLILTFLIILFAVACNENQPQTQKNVVITISVKDQVVVNSDTVSVDSLQSKLAEIGVEKNTNIRIVPDPEAGPAMIEKVQRIVRTYQN